MTSPHTDGLTGRDVALRAVAAAEADELLASFGAARASGRNVGERAASDERMTWLAIAHGERIAGLIYYRREPPGRPPRAWIEVAFEPAADGPGLATDAIRTLAAHLLEERGYRRVSAHPDAGDETAIRCFEDAGFHRVGVERSARRGADGAWCDAMLLERVKHAPAAG